MITSVLFSLFFIFTLQFETNAQTRFVDIPAEQHELVEAVTYLSNQKIVNGYADGTFGPNDPITREQFAVILARTLKLDTANTVSQFPDVLAGSFYASSIEKLSEMSVINGFPDGQFHPKAFVTRIQAATMLNRAFQIRFTEDDYFFVDIEPNNSHIKALYFNGITNGLSDTAFGPHHNITRGQASIFIYRILQMDKRGNVIYYTDSFLPITSTKLVEQSDTSVRLVPSINGLRIIPLREGKGHFIVKGMLRDATVPLEQYVAYAYEVKLQNGKYYVLAKEDVLAEVIEHESNFYSFESLHLSFSPTTATVVNAFNVPISSDLYYIGRNETGLEIAFFEPGQYTITLSNGEKTKQLIAQTTIQNFSTQTTIMQH